MYQFERGGVSEPYISKTVLVVCVERSQQTHRPWLVREVRLDLEGRQRVGICMARQYSAVSYSTVYDIQHFAQNNDPRVGPVGYSKTHADAVKHPVGSALSLHKHPRGPTCCVMRA